MQLEEVLAIEAHTRRGTGTVRVITPYGSLTVDQILGRQGEMFADDTEATIRGEPLPDRDPLRLLAKLRALRDSGVISAAEFEIYKLRSDGHLGDRSGVAIPGTARHTGCSAPQRWATWGR